MSSMDWLRLWHGTPVDQKLTMIAKRAGARRCEMTALWECLLDHASQNSERGYVGDVDLEVIAFSQEIDLDVVQAMYRGLEEKRVIVDGRIVNWRKRQPEREDPTAAERQRKHREQQRDIRDTYNKEDRSHNVTQSHDTSRLDKIREDTEQIETIPPNPPEGEPAEPAVREVPKQLSARAPRKRQAEAEVPPEFEEFWQLYPKRDGVKGSRALALAEFVAKPPGDWQAVLAATQVYATVCGPNGERRRPKDAERFLKDDTFWRGMLAISPDEIGAAERSSGYAADSKHKSATERQVAALNGHLAYLAASEDDQQVADQSLPPGRQGTAEHYERGRPKILELTARDVG